MNNEIATDFGDRVITLPDGRPGLRGTLQVDVRQSDPSAPDAPHSAPILDFISSDETLDRYGEIIVASGWRLDNYRRNPVFQNAHQYGDVIFTLGRALITEVRTRQPSTTNSQPSTCLFQRIEFATEVNPMARIAYGLYRGKFLNAVSVGFIPLRWENPSQLSSIPSASTPPRRVYLEQELLEVSAVGIPANPNALALGVKAGVVGKSDLRELHDLLRQTLGGAREEENWEPVPIKVKRPGKKEKELTELLRLAREVRDLLKA